MTDIKVGDSVVCIDNNTEWGKLTIGKVYTVIKISPGDVFIQCDTGDKWYYELERFSTKPPSTDGWDIP